MRLYHVSEEAGIARFEPRSPGEPNPASVDRPVVWAIEDRLLHNYLLPRDCPRVTFYPRPESHPADVDRFFGATSAQAVLAVEWGWLPVIRRTTLYLYELPAAGFRVNDAGAGYFVCDQAVAPVAVRRVDDLLAELASRQVELRLLPSLWPLLDAVVGSTLQFSCIRMRNARPRD